MKPITLFALLLLAVILLAVGGCPGAPGDSGGRNAQSAGAKALTQDELVQASLFNIEGMENATPYSLDLDRPGKRVYTQYKIKGSPVLRTGCFALTNGRLQPEAQIAPLPEVTRPFIDAAPEKLECLTIGNYQTETSRVNDRVYVSATDMSRLVTFESVPGIPADRPMDDLYNLSPFFSWDGKSVIVPLKYSGVVVHSLEPVGYKYLAYPEFAAEATGMKLHALPNQHGKRKIVASIWKAGLYEDDCRLYTLDLDNPAWTEVGRLKWIVYQVGGLDLENEPWLVAGSRGKEDATEHERTPIYGLFDPASGVTEVLRSFGEPVWQIEVEPYGEYVLYLDRQRQALVRLNPKTGALDFDSRWFNDEAKIIASVGGKVVLTWYRSTVLLAEWSGHEQQEGYAQ